MKTILTLSLTAAMGLGLLTGCGSSGEALEKPEPEKLVKIGVFEPQTGDNGPGGKQETLGMQYGNALFPTVEIGGESYQVQLEYVDNQTTAENGPPAAAELIDRDVSIVLGSYGSSVSMAGGEVFLEAGMPAIGATCTNPSVTLDNPCYFRICFTDPFQGPALASYATEELDCTMAYTLAMLDSDYDQGLVHYFTEAFEAKGGTVLSEDFPEGCSDFTSYITNAKAAGASIIFAPVSINYAQRIIEAAHAQGFEGSLLGSDTWDSNIIVETARGKDVRIAVTTFYQEGANPEFDAGIKKWINDSPDALKNNAGNDMVSAVTTMGYDAYMTALEALKLANSTDQAQVLNVLPEVELDGVSGRIHFDENGDSIRTEAVIKTVNTETGQWDFVKIQKVD